MKIRPVWTIALACFFLATVSSRCSRPVRENQVRLGIWAADNNLWEEAAFRWKKAVDATPRSAAAHNNLAVALEKKGRWEDARREYEEALRLAPENAQIKANFQNFKDNMESPAKGEDPKTKDSDDKK